MKMKLTILSSFKSVKVGNLPQYDIVSNMEFCRQLSTLRLIEDIVTYFEQLVYR